MHVESTASRHGVVVARGYGIKISVQRGHLIVHDGVGRERRTLRLHRATGGVKRLIVIGHTGFVTLEALRWLQDVGAAFAQIDCNGNVIAVSADERFHNTELRRAQALAGETGDARVAMTGVLASKLEHQARTADRLRDLKQTVALDRGKQVVPVSAAIRQQAAALAAAENVHEMRSAEAVAGRLYWQVIARVPIRFSASHRGSVPEHWFSAGPRVSAGCGGKGPRRAVSPLHALINYTYAVLEVEATLALYVWGFDPSIGLLHTDQRYRTSLTADLMEAVRPVADELVLDLVAARVFDRRDLHETRQGVCRLGQSVAREIAELRGPLRQALEPHARQLARTLVGSRQARSKPARRRATRVVQD